MRLERQRRRRPSQLGGAGARGRDHRLVAAMHPVEIADGDHRPAQRDGPAGVSPWATTNAWDGFGFFAMASYVSGDTAAGRGWQG